MQHKRFSVLARGLGKSAVCIPEFIGRVLALLGDRTNRKPTYPNLSLDDLRKLVVPDFNATGEDAVNMLAAAYDRHAEDTLLPLPQMDSCEVRRGLDGEFVGVVRRQLGSEPSVTGNRYGG